MWLVQWSRENQFTFQIKRSQKKTNQKMDDYKWIRLLKLFSSLIAMTQWPQKINVWKQERMTSLEWKRKSSTENERFMKYFPYFYL